MLRKPLNKLRMKVVKIIALFILFFRGIFMENCTLGLPENYSNEEPPPGLPIRFNVMFFIQEITIDDRQSSVTVREISESFCSS